MKYILTSILIFSFSNYLISQSLTQQLQQALDSIYQAHPSAIGIVAHVEAKNNGVSWSGAAGLASKTGDKLDPSQPVLIASSIKTYVAATILRLVEEEKLSLETALIELLSEPTKKMFVQDGYDLSKIKVKHLLSHTSGIEDYATQAYIDDKAKRPKYRWTRDEQLALAIQVGDPLGQPGKVFSYADANYLLLTEIMEQVTKKPFYKVMRELLKYKELGIDHTWFPTLEKEPKNTKPLVHQYWKQYNWDTYDLDISWDLYGGGGIACPIGDLAKFSYHFFNGDIVENDSIQNLIFTEVPTKATELYAYYLGLSQDNYHGMNGFGHGGFWSTVMMHFPSINASIAVCILERDERRLRRNVTSELSRIIKNEILKTEKINQSINSYLNGLTDFSGTILIAQEGSVVEKRAYGLANIPANINNTIETKFNIASISKLFTAVAVMQLVEKKQLDLNEPIGSYLKDYPNQHAKDSIKIHHLLTHTSGLQPFYPNRFLQADKLKFKKLADFLPLFVNDTLAFAPGSNYQYSGSGFVVLGLIIEQVSGMDYYDYMSEHIFKPAGMLNTIAPDVDAIISNKAEGYTSLVDEKETLRRNDYYLAKASAAGMHYSTAEDLHRFIKAMNENILLSPESTSLLLQTRVKGYNTHYGYGIDIDKRYNETIFGHSGGWYGVRAEILNFEASNYSAVVLSNQDDDGESGASKVIDDLKTMIGGSKRN